MMRTKFAENLPPSMTNPDGMPAARGSAQEITPFLQLREVVRTFGDFVANDSITLDVRRGEVHALLGENGAGKTTLMRIVAGIITPDSGTISLDGQQVDIRDPRHASTLGIQMVHQHFALIDSLTVAENVHLARIERLSGRLDVRAAIRDLDSLIGAYKLDLDPAARVGTLSVGGQQRVEIARALAQGARLLILDEPTAVLTPQETASLLSLVRKLSAEGVAILFISHKLSEVMEIADRVTVLRDGKVVVRLGRGEMSVERMSVAMVGRSFHPTEPPIEDKSSHLGEAALDVRDVHGSPVAGSVGLRGVTFTLRRGEILGVVGVDGNGQSELVDTIVGVTRPSAGTVTLCRGQAEPNGHGGHTTIPGGVAHIPDDRMRKGLFPNLPIWENLLVRHPNRPGTTRGGLVIRRRAMAHAAERLRAFGLRAGLVRARPEALSGGMLQRVLLARELDGEASVIVASQPTRGLDIAGMNFVWNTLRELRASGRAVLLVSTELEEVLALADRIIVMFRGEITGERARGSYDIVSIGLLMGGEMA